MMAIARQAKAQVASSLTFTELAHGRDETLHVAPGYTTQVLMRWGDKVSHDAPDFDPLAQTAEAQSKQFGYNISSVSCRCPKAATIPNMAYSPSITNTPMTS